MTLTISMPDNEFLLNDSSTIIYGDSGIGKTTIAKCMPKPLFIIMRGGGEHRPAPLIGSGIPFVEVLTRDDLNELVMMLPKNKGEIVIRQQVTAATLPEAINRVRDAGGNVETIRYRPETLVFDQLSSMYDIYMRGVMKSVVRNRENPDTPAQQDYQQTGRIFSNFLMDINQIPGVHKVYLALSEIDEDRKTGERYGAPMIPGKLALDVLKLVDFVFRMHVRREVVANKIEEFRCFQTQPDGIWRAKDSTGTLPAFIKLPSPNYNYWEQVIVPAIKKK